MAANKKIVIGTLSYRCGEILGTLGGCVIGTKEDVLNEVFNIIKENLDGAIEEQKDIRIELLNIRYLGERGR